MVPESGLPTLSVIGAGKWTRWSVTRPPTLVGGDEARKHSPRSSIIGAGKWTRWSVTRPPTFVGGDEAKKYPPTSSIIGAGKWTRTTDQLLTKQLLCQLSYSGHGKIVAKVLWRRTGKWNRWSVTRPPPIAYEATALPTELFRPWQDCSKSPVKTCRKVEAMVRHTGPSHGHHQLLTKQLSAN